MIALPPSPPPPSEHVILTERGRQLTENGHMVLAVVAAIVALVCLILFVTEERPSR